MIPTCEPNITEEDIASVMAALRAGHAAVGPEVEAFERAVAERVGLPYAVAVSSGTAALMLALQAWPHFQKWSVPTLNFMAAAEAVIASGARPVFVDAGRPAMLQTYLYGHPPEVCGVIDDACEALGSVPVGQRGIITCLSFNGNKIITAGAGGMVLTADVEVADKVRSLSSHCRIHPTQWIHGDCHGSNYRMPAMNAALGLSQLRRLDAHLAAKRETALHYAEGVAPLGATIMEPLPGTTTNWWMPVIRLDRIAAPIITMLHAEGIMARPLWYPLHLQPPFNGSPQSLPIAEDLWRTSLILPCSVGITPLERKEVLAALARALGRGATWRPRPS